MSRDHLSETELVALLAGETPEPAMTAHMHTCERCRAEVSTMGAAVTSFNEVSLRWAEAVAPRRVPAPSRLALRLGGRPAWRAGLVATAAVCLLAVGLQLHPAAGPDHGNAGVASAMPSTATLAEDNRLMASIDQALGDDVQPAVPVSQLRSPALRGGQRARATDGD